MKLYRDEEESMKNKINAAIAKVSPQQLCAENIGPQHELDAIGITEIKRLDLVMDLEREVADEDEAEIIVPDDLWAYWVTVGDIYKFYGVA